MDPRILWAILIIVGGTFAYIVVDVYVADCKRKAEMKKRRKEAIEKLAPTVKELDSQMTIKDGMQFD